jgi:hypothetical protein
MDQATRIERVTRVLDEIIGGCRDVKSNVDLHEHAKSLAALVIRDCNRAKSALEGKEFPGDHAG